MSDLNKIVTKIGKRKGIHYRPHRTNPKDFIVIKIYRRWPKNTPTELEAKELLADYLAGIGVKPSKGIIRGSQKWIAIIDREKFEKKTKKKAKEDADTVVASQDVIDAIKKTQSKEKTQTQTKVKVKKPKYTSTMAGDEKLYVHQTVGGGEVTSGPAASGGGYSPSWTPGQYGGGYKLDHEDLDMRDLIHEGREILADFELVEKRSLPREPVGSWEDTNDIEDELRSAVVSLLKPLKSKGLKVSKVSSAVVIGSPIDLDKPWQMEVYIAISDAPKPTSSLTVRLVKGMNRDPQFVAMFDKAGKAFLPSVQRVMGNVAKLGRPRARSVKGRGYMVIGDAVPNALSQIKKSIPVLAKAIADPIRTVLSASL